MFGNSGGQGEQGFKGRMIPDGSNKEQSGQKLYGDQGRQNWDNNNPCKEGGRAELNQGYEEAGEGNQAFNQGFQQGFSRGFTQGFQQGLNQGVQRFQQNCNKCGHQGDRRSSSNQKNYDRKEKAEKVEDRKEKVEKVEDRKEKVKKVEDRKEIVEKVEDRKEKVKKTKDRKAVIWTKLADIKPADDNLNLNVKILSLTKIGGSVGHPGKYRCVIADSSAFSNAFFSAKIELKEGDCIVLFNAQAQVVKQHIQIQLNQKRGKMEKSHELVDSVNLELNISLNQWVVFIE